MDEVVIIGGGIGGLTLGLALHAAGISLRIYEAAPEVTAVGVGINLLPHATRHLAALGLEPELGRVGITTSDATFFNRFGQLIYQEPLGRFAGYEHPQFSIHRGDLQMVLLKAFQERAGADRVVTGHRCIAVEQGGDGVTVAFEDPRSGARLSAAQGSVAVACDGIHSAVRKQFFPHEGEPRYSGVNMWRGVTKRTPFLSGASMARAGWLSHGKMVIYPIRNLDGGLQLINWVAEVETPTYRKRDWNRPGRVEDFIGLFENWHFDWLDIPALIRDADVVLEFPMVDQDPLPQWSFGRVTLLGDAAHPMVPRGSNGAGQAILDVDTLVDALRSHAGDPAAALKDYEHRRREATAKVVLTNRTNPPDAILREVVERTGDAPFADIEAVISRKELQALSESYKRISGQSHART